MSEKERSNVGSRANLCLPLKNVMLFAELVDRVQNRPRHLPGMACFYGPSGYGKSRSATFGAHKSGAFYVECDASFTTKTLCERILIELGLGGAVRGSVPSLIAAIIDRLAETQDRPLIIDEADFLVKKGMIDHVRAMHDKSQAPVILIGEELLPHKLQAHERAHNRMLDWVAAQPCDLEDTALIATRMAGGVEIAEDLVAEIAKASGGRVRRVMVNLEQVVSDASTRGKRTMRLADWTRPFFTGEPPKRRAT
jgi:DNA transposition AAA+ family ATPase